MQRLVGERTSGRFWLPGAAPDETVGGWLDLTGRWPRLELAENITPSLRQVSQETFPDGSQVSRYVPADDDVELDTITIHGLLRTGPTRVTLVGCFNIHRGQVQGGPVPDPGEETLQVGHALLGANVLGSTRFQALRLRLRHLDVWAQLPGISAEFHGDGSRVSIEYEAGDDEAAVELEEPAGRLTLRSDVQQPDVDLRGGRFTRTAALHWEAAAAGLSFDELWQRIVEPVDALLTLAVDADSPPVSLEVAEGPGDRWLQVVHPGLAAEENALLPAHQVLLTRQHFGLRVLSRWVTRSRALSPISQLVTGVAAKRASRALQLLEMAAAAEGLHRRLFPDARVMAPTQAKQAQRDARYAVLEEVRDRVRQALGFLERPTYAERLGVLVEMGKPGAPNVAGSTDAWIAKITSARNGFAHLLDRVSNEEDQWREQLVLTRTLRFLLTSVLLQDAGVDAAALAQRLSQHRPYQHLQAQARRWVPSIYSSEPEHSDV